MILAMKTVLAIALCIGVLPGSGTAEGMTEAERLMLACKGWSVARLMNGTVTQKHSEMIDALDAIAHGNPAKPLARAVAENLSTIARFMSEARESTDPAWQEVCGDIEFPNLPAR